MALLLLALVLVVSGCGSSGVAKSSLTACDFSRACGAGELCDVSQTCGPPVADGGVSCGEVEGDRLCHRDCSETKECADGETCTEVSLFKQTDFTTPSWLCL